MRVALRSPVFWGIFALFQVYWLGFWFVSPVQLNLVLLALRFTLSVAICTAFAKPAWRSVRMKRMSGVHQLILGIFFTWAAVGAQSCWSLIYMSLYNESPADSPFTGFLLWMILWGQTLHVTAPQTDLGHSLNFQSLRHVIIAAIIGGLLVLYPLYHALN